jgi:3-oxoacyl-(acyl-carrier-protein) synthase
LGDTLPGVWAKYLSGTPLLRKIPVKGGAVMAGALPERLLTEVRDLKYSKPNYNSLDNSVLFAMLAARKAVLQSSWEANDIFGVNIGSSRGATDLFEKHHSHFLETGKAALQSSPSTTLGNISSWVAQDLKSAGPDISHSITCSTALHAVLNGVAWLRAGMANKFLVGGSEAPLTPFTISQMQAMKIYSPLDDEYASRAMDLDKKSSTMVLGEGAAMACLEAGYNPKAMAVIEGIGYATEILTHSVSLSSNAHCLQKSMKMALGNTPLDEVDAIVMHAPGTVKGDTSEYNAIKKIFGEKLPLLTTNKWQIGHTFGASGLLSLELALLMLQNDTFITSPFYPQKQDRPLRKILINAVGFGGNAVSLLIAK